MKEFLLNQLSFYGTFDDKETKIIENSFREIDLKKDEYFLKEDKVCNYVGLIKTGLLLYIKISDDGQEVVVDFGKENEWVTQYQSFISRTKASLNIKACEQTTIFRISYDKLIELYETVPRMESVVRKLLEKVFIQMVQRTEDFQTLKAEERYEKLMLENPSILQRVPQYYIASYLGTAPQSLSRIRKNV